jgi:hypothetical protein
MYHPFQYSILKCHFVIHLLKLSVLHLWLLYYNVINYPFGILICIHLGQAKIHVIIIFYQGKKLIVLHMLWRFDLWWDFHWKYFSKYLNQIYHFRFVIESPSTIRMVVLKYRYFRVFPSQREHFKWVFLFHRLLWSVINSFIVKFVLLLWVLAFSIQ